MNLLERWNTLWSRTAQSDPLERYDALSGLYNEPHRSYHNLHHIQDCLNQFDSTLTVPDDPDAVELALWLHDVVYTIGAQDNEEQSAEWARATLSRGRVSDTLLQRVTALILATKHPSVPETADAELVVDIDLSILGRPWDEFTQYEKRIRQEYQQVSDARYRSGRATILQGFLDRPSIYFTDTFQEKYELQARENLAHSIATVQG